MGKKEIANSISRDLGLTQQETKEIVQKVLDGVVQALVDALDASMHSRFRHPWQENKIGFKKVVEHYVSSSRLLSTTTKKELKINHQAHRTNILKLR